MKPEFLPKNDDKKLLDSGLSTLVLAQIEKDHVTQVPRWQFLLTEYGVWVSFGVVVFIGAIAVSMMVFFMLHAGFALYEATHDTPLDLLIDVLPVAWIATFLLMAVLAHYNLRYTKKGYKYRVWQILLSSILLSLALGFVFYTVGFSFVVDAFVEHQIPLFPGLKKVETRIWQAPEQGRMAGVYVGNGTSEDVVIFNDSNGTTWQLNTAELNDIDLRNLLSGNQVHVLGVPSSTTDAYFYGCGVFPWMEERNPSFADIQNERQTFIAHMEEHEGPLMSRSFATNTPDGETLHAICSGHAAVLRIKHEFLH